jgi:hypothetical protein
MSGMKLLALSLSLIALGFAAEDPWSKVIALSSGAEIRIFKSGAKEPVVAKFSEADAERIIVVVKNEQSAIERKDIEKLEARPMGVKTLKKETQTKNLDPSAELAKPTPSVPGSRPTPSMQSTSSGLSYSGKPGFELVYRKSGK